MGREGEQKASKKTGSGKRAGVRVKSFTNPTRRVVGSDFIPEPQQVGFGVGEKPDRRERR